MKKIDLENLELYRGAISPGKRMTPELLAFFCENSESWGIRANCASGIRIVFETDSRHLKWSCKFGAVGRPVYTADVFVDDKMTTLEGEGPHCLELASGKKKIELYLPHLVVLEDYSVEVDDSAFVKAVPENRRKLLICGDSIVQGMTCSSPARVSVAIAARELDMDLHNVSVGGVTMRSEILEHALGIGENFVFVALGINDISQQTTEEVFRKHLRKTLEYLSASKAKCFIITPIPSTRVELESRRSWICNMIREEQKKVSGVTLIEGESFFPADDTLLCDQLHPNDEGMIVYARGLIDAVKNAERL